MGARALAMTRVRIHACPDAISALQEADHVAASHTDLGRLLGLCG